MSIEPLFNEFQTASQIHTTKELICGKRTITVSCNFSLLTLTKKYPTVHVILLFRSVWEFRPYAQGSCRTHTVRPHAYGLANHFYTLNPLLTHTPYGPVRTRMVHINEPQPDKTNKLTFAPSEDSDQHGHPPSLIRVFAHCALNG